MLKIARVHEVLKKRTADSRMRRINRIMLARRTYKDSVNKGSGVPYPALTIVLLLL